MTYTAALWGSEGSVRLCIMGTMFDSRIMRHGAISLTPSLQILAYSY